VFQQLYADTIVSGRMCVHGTTRFQHLFTAGMFSTGGEFYICGK
jgi:hypothetical protein